MMTQEIQEMLEGLLSNEETAEVLHRLSVSPEKLTAFRQHMALRGALERDSRASRMTEEEDNAVWAALMGATGGIVTGGAASGAGGWLARAAAFIATGIAGFFIGTAVDGNHPTANIPAPATAQLQQSASIAQSTPPALRIDTVVRTIVQPQHVYHYDTVFISIPGAHQDILQASPVDRSSDQPLTSRSENMIDGVYSTNSHPRFDAAKQSPTFATTSAINASSTRKGALLNQLDGQKGASPQTTVAEVEEVGLDKRDPNNILKNSNPQLVRNTPRSTVSLIRSGWEIAYNEQAGKITPSPVNLDNADPNFGSRALDLSYHLLNGHVGIGLRLMYGSFARVTLVEEPWLDLGIKDTVFRTSLGTEKGFGTELFFNYRLSLFGDRIALEPGIAMGASATHSKIGGDLSLLYLITNRIGAQAGIGYSGYWYNTRQLRQDALSGHKNTGISADLNDVYRGTMLEGHYGLFFRF